MSASEAFYLSPLRGSIIFCTCFLGLLTAFGRRDAPSPASGRWPAIPSLGHISLPPAGSRPRLIICRRFAARTVDQGWEFFVAKRWRRFPLRPTMSAMERRRCFSSKRVMLAIERRRRDRYLARGVSPGVGEQNTNEPPEGATDT